jgi:uridine phosphorylase
MGRYVVTPQQTLSIARQAGLADERLARPDVAVLTFSRALMERLEELCGLEEVAWISPRHHPYAAARIVKRGVFEGMRVMALVPPMGASPLACIVEDLVASGVGGVFLACAAWSLGPPVQFGDLIVPGFSMGPDGTSIHYSAHSESIPADKPLVEALSAAGRELGATVHVGGNGSCEALYRITPEMIAKLRQQGCLCMDNGEASTLFAVTRTQGITGGVVFQPYIELEHGWDPSRLKDARFSAACRLQAEAVLGACVQLQTQGLLEGIQTTGGSDERANIE